MIIRPETQVAEQVTLQLRGEIQRLREQDPSLHERGNPWRFAQDSGLFTLGNEDLPSPEFRQLAAGLASHPSRVSKPEFLINLVRDYGGIVSSRDRGVAKHHMFDVVKGHEDRIHITFGIPYVGLNTRTGPNARTSQRNTLVVFSNSVRQRPDLRISPIDIGLLYSRNNPFVGLVKSILEQHPNWTNTQYDPTLMLYQLIAEDQKSLRWFKQYMESLVSSVQLTPRDLEPFLALMLQQNLDESQIPLRKLCLNMPNGSVKGRLPIKQWQAVIVHEEEYWQLHDMAPKLRPLLVNASAVQHSVARTGDDLQLLEAYADVAGVRPGLQGYISRLAKVH